MAQTVVGTKKTVQMHQANGSAALMPNIHSMPAEKQKKLMVNFFLEAQNQIANLEEGIQKDETVIKQTNKSIKESTLMKKLKSKKHVLQEKKKLKTELLARYTGAKILADKLGIDVDLTKIKMIEG